MKVKVTYFKDTGKYYSEGYYDTDIEEYRIPEEFREMRDRGESPGLIGNDPTFYCLLEVAKENYYKYGNWSIIRLELPGGIDKSNFSPIKGEI